MVASGFLLTRLLQPTNNARLTSTLKGIGQMLLKERDGLIGRNVGDPEP